MHRVLKVTEELSWRGRVWWPSLGRREKFPRNMQPGAIDQVCGRTAGVLPPDCSDAEEDQGKLVHPIWATEASLQ